MRYFMDNIGLNVFECVLSGLAIHSEGLFIFISFPMSSNEQWVLKGSLPLRRNLKLFRLRTHLTDSNHNLFHFLELKKLTALRNYFS